MACRCSAGQLQNGRLDQLRLLRADETFIGAVGNVFGDGLGRTRLLRQTGAALRRANAVNRLVPRQNRRPTRGLASLGSNLAAFSQICKKTSCKTSWASAGSLRILVATENISVECRS